MTTPAGWRPDPYGRYQQRNWDGSAWTAHVIDGHGTQLVDPMGTSTAIPFALPNTAVGDGGPAAAGATDAHGFAAPTGPPLEAPLHPEGDAVDSDRDAHDGDAHDGDAHDRDAHDRGDHGSDDFSTYGAE